MMGSSSAVLLWAVQALIYAAPNSVSSVPIDATDSARSGHEKVCNSLTGPFCLHLGVDASFSTYMTPIDPDDLYKAGSSARRSLEDLVGDQKKCFFQHFSRSWMDAGGEANDLMNQEVHTIDECERLCCTHPKCKSYTFWRGRTCFLRAKKNVPREDGDSFSANKLQG